ncbi:MAG: rRNA pseudouridine synthase [Spirochaetales bacterium]|nr:rRNA pseudouridine synthase [Spirochaetales bacterium]
MIIEYPVRLQVYLAKCGVGSRRFCEDLISQGRVMVNNKVIREMGVKVTEDDVVQVDTETVEVIDKTYYIALYKPKGYVCTNYDPNETKYARDLINIRDRDLLFNVGRLDKDSSGLLLFTNDGDFANKVTHPKFEIEKEYLVHLDRSIDIADLNKALGGVFIDTNKPYKLKSYEFVPRRKDYIRVTLTEGKNREVRKIFSFLGYEVKSLLRMRIGCILLGNMQSGEYRNLTKKELDGLLEGKTSLDPRKKFGAALRKEKEEKARRRAEKKREEFK